MRIGDWSSDVCSSDLLDAGRDLVLRDVRESDAADLLPVTQELGPAQDVKPAECLLQRVGLARTGAGLETEAATIVEASEDALPRNAAGGVGWALPISHGRAVRRDRKSTRLNSSH